MKNVIYFIKIVKGDKIKKIYRIFIVILSNHVLLLDVCKRLFDPRYPVGCMDESPKQLFAETKVPIPASPGHTSIHDYEYMRCVVGNIFLACEPLAGRGMVKITETKTKRDRAYFLEKIAGQYENA